MAPNYGSNGTALYLIRSEFILCTTATAHFVTTKCNNNVCRWSLTPLSFHLGFLLLIVIAACDGLQLLEGLGDVVAVLRGRHRRRRGGRRGWETLLGAGEDAVVEPGRGRGGAVLRLE